MQKMAMWLSMVLSCGVAQGAPAPVRAEIDALLAKMEDSHCEFGRNGAWYPPAEARKHLLDKLKYLERNHEVGSTEQFIAQVATGSSMSGKPYLVRCDGVEPVESAQWLGMQIKTLRGTQRALAVPVR